jgi:hypothetical protein
MKIKFPVPRRVEDCEMKADEVSRLDNLFRGMTLDEAKAEIARRAEAHARAFSGTLAEWRR